MDGESLSESLLLGGINLGKEKWWVPFAQFLGSTGVLWGKFLAVTTMVKQNIRIGMSDAYL